MVMGRDGAIMAPPQVAAVPRVAKWPSERDQPVEHEADQADVDEGHDDVGDAGGVPRVPDEEADADAADQHLGRDDGEPGQADADAQAR